MAHIFGFLEFDLIFNSDKDPASWDLRIEGDKDARHHPELLRVIP